MGNEHKQPLTLYLCDRAYVAADLDFDTSAMRRVYLADDVEAALSSLTLQRERVEELEVALNSAHAELVATRREAIGYMNERDRLKFDLHQATERAEALEQDRRQTDADVFIVTDWPSGGVRGVFHSRADAEKQIAAICAEYGDLSREAFAIGVYRLHGAESQTATGEALRQTLQQKIAEWRTKGEQELREATDAGMPAAMGVAAMRLHDANELASLLTVPQGDEQKP